MESNELLEELGMAITPPEPPADSPLSISFASSKLQGLISDWSSNVENNILKGRENRLKSVDIQQLRRDKKLLADESFYPDHIINTNITREKPAFLQYLVGPVNLAVFTDPEDIGENFEDVASAFSTLLKYTNWEDPHIRNIDCALAHGMGFVEVLYDANAPGRVSVEYVSLNDIVFPIECENIQQQLFVMRRYRWTSVALKRNAKNFQFDVKQTELLLESIKEQASDHAEVYKVYIRQEEGLYIAFWSPSAGSEWLRKPQPFDIGLGTVETYLPFVPLFKDLVEEPKYLAVKGECITSAPTQEAVSALQSSVVNQAHRAANPVFSPDGIGESAGQEPILFMSGTVTKNPLKMHKLDAPDPNIFALSEKLRSQNQDAHGHVNYAVNNRQGSRKTATEVMSADAMATKLQSVSVVNLANYLRAVYTYAWRIVKHYALQNEILLVGARDEYGNIINDLNRIDRNFIITPTGGSEQARITDTKNAMAQVLPLVKGTALEKVIISDYLRYALPSLGTRYQKIYRTSVVAQDLTLQLLQGTIERLTQGAPQPDGSIAVTFQPQEIQQFQQTYAGYKQAYGVLGDPSGGSGSMANMPSDEDTIAAPTMQPGIPVSSEEQPGDTT